MTEYLLLCALIGFPGLAAVTAYECSVNKRQDADLIAILAGLLTAVVTFLVFKEMTL